MCVCVPKMWLLWISYAIFAVNSYRWQCVTSISETVLLLPRVSSRSEVIMLGQMTNAQYTIMHYALYIRVHYALIPDTLTLAVQVTCIRSSWHNRPQFTGHDVPQCTG